MRSTLSRWIERKLVERPFHECEGCGDTDTTHEALSTGEIVCWRCAVEAGEFSQMEWRIGAP